jgi:hypothetical protein
MYVTLSALTTFNCLHTPAQRQYSIIRHDFWIATSHRLARHNYGYPRLTDGAHVCSFDAFDYHAYNPHAGSAGFACIVLEETKNFGRYLGELNPHHCPADGSWAMSRTPYVGSEQKATRDAVLIGG